MSSVAVSYQRHYAFWLSVHDHILKSLRHCFLLQLYLATMCNIFGHTL